MSTNLSLNSLGVIVPKPDEWLTFPGLSIEVETFRISFSGLPSPLRSFVLIRSIYFFEFSQATRVFPGDSQLLYLPYPPILLQSGDVARSLQIRKWFYRPYANLVISDDDYSVTIEEVLGVQ